VIITGFAQLGVMQALLSASKTVGASWAALGCTGVNREMLLWCALGLMVMLVVVVVMELVRGLVGEALRASF